MEKKNRLAGRFLPSRVYARWVWTVRSCLGMLPVILFLSGALTLYLSAGRFKSSTTFEYLGQRSLADVAALLESSNLLEGIHDSLDLTKRLGVDQETATTILRESTEIRLIPATRQMQVEVVMTPAELSRDVAAEFPKALDAYEISLAEKAIHQRIAHAERDVISAEDSAAMAEKDLARLVSLRGEANGDALAQLDVDTARAAWSHANTQLLEARSLVENLNRELASPGTWVALHSIPQIASTAVGPETEDTLGWVVLRSFGIGLVCALAIPYLLELAFPRRHRKSAAATPTWQDAESDITAEPSRA
ncbi:MAG: hypothetical protein V4640_09705 [Verrucomicrobiota bacterium]